MSYQCDAGANGEECGLLGECLWCLMCLEHSLATLGHNLAVAGALCGAGGEGNDDVVRLDGWRPNVDGKPMPGWKP